MSDNVSFVCTWGRPDAELATRLDAMESNNSNMVAKVPDVKFYDVEEGTTSTWAEAFISPREPNTNPNVEAVVDFLLLTYLAP